MTDPVLTSRAAQVLCTALLTGLAACGGNDFSAALAPDASADDAPEENVIVPVYAPDGGVRRDGGVDGSLDAGSSGDGSPLDATSAGEGGQGGPSCLSGVPCAAGSCEIGIVVCDGGTPQCAHGSPAGDGTSCDDAGSVCSNGTCAAC